MSGTYILRKGHAQLSDLVDGSGLGYPGPLYPGKNYYVNNYTGSAGASGESWGDAMDQVSVAITASEAHQATHESGNQAIFNNIYVQGTNTVYTGITDTGERSNFVGVSAGTMMDGGSGQVRIGSGTDGDGCLDDSNSRGNSWYNLQFIYGAAGHWGFKNSAWIQRSRFTEVTFMQAASGAAGCFNAVGMSGTIIERCQFVSNSGGTQATYGLYTTGQTLSLIHI